MTNAMLSTEDIESEKTVVNSELGMYENNPLYKFRQDLMQQ